MASATKELNFSLILINLHLNSHMWLVSQLLDSATLRASGSFQKTHAPLILGLNFMQVHPFIFTRSVSFRKVAGGCIMCRQLIARNGTRREYWS